MKAVTAKCPRCGSAVNAAPDAEGYVSCPQCAVRLRVVKPSPSPPASAQAAAPAPTPAAASTLDAVLAEVRVLHGLVESVSRTQRDMLEIVKSLAAAPTAPEAQGLADALPEVGEQRPSPSAPSPRMRRRQKTVLLIDDHPETREAAEAAFAKAHVPVRAVGDGNSALAEIASERPDIIVLELDLGGAMSGKDVVNMIKATMEWLDIPIVLYTRVPIESQKEARQIHGGDEHVAKGPGSAEALVARVIAIFQKAC